jgi:8-oxo-dGTP diphosphatase
MGRQMSRILLAGVVIENSNGEFALQLRDDIDSLINAGMWSIFGGHIEAGEIPIDAAIREISEELTVDLSRSKLQEIGKFEIDNKIFYVFHYRVNQEMKNAVLQEGQDWKWCSREEITSGTIKGRSVVSYHVQFFERLWNGKYINN